MKETLRMGSKSLFLLLFCITGIVSCDNFSQKQFEFYYYPQKNIYYSVTDKEYFYSLDGGATWDSVAATTTTEPPTLGAKEIVYSNSPDIYTQNSTHLQQFNGRPVNITGTDTGTANQGLAAERKAKKVNTTNNAQTTKEAEKKPGFFKRLFGKKNK